MSYDLSEPLTAANTFATSLNPNFLMAKDLAKTHDKMAFATAGQSEPQAPRDKALDSLISRCQSS